MRRARLIVLALLLATPARAQIYGTPIEISGSAGIMSPDTRARADVGPAYGGAIGWRFQSWLVGEGYALFAPSKSDSAPFQNHNWSFGGLALRMNMRPAEDRLVPFFTLGMGYGLSHTQGHEPEKLERGAPVAGLGALINIHDQRAFLRVEARDFFMRERDSGELSNHVALTAGLHWLWGGKPRDSDLDGVRDWLDECPATPLGATVNDKGCPGDADGDQVFDGIDKCPGTPAGCNVGADGCPLDADQDGVCDSVDTCADTPKGATVDAKGCPSDRDGDAIFDGIDACEGTPQACQVDEKGCPKDSDQDGVCDGLDKCPGTAAGLQVNLDGCVVEAVVRETELMDTGRIRLQDVRFETGKADILPESHSALDAVGEVLTKWPVLKIEIGGHTDARGSDAANQRLSEARARAVLDYLKGKFTTLEAAQFTVKGYGESLPIAPNDTPEGGMARNRRVKFVVLDKGVLKREIERRRLLQKGESQPANPAPEDVIQPTPEPAPADTSKGGGR